MSTSLLAHGAGLIVAYTVYGLLQERIIKGTYGPEALHFESPSLLILCNRLFAVAVAVGIVAWRDRKSGAAIMSAAWRPTAPLQHFGHIALYNFLASTCQYTALSSVSFTTMSLAKTIKMVPVLVVGYVCYSKKATSREWIAAGTIALGCATYLSTTRGGPSILDDDDAFYDSMVGTLSLVGYLFFDGLTSTTQERYFGLSSSSTDPFGPESSVLPQMLFVNLFTSLISFVGLAVDAYLGNLAPSLSLLARTPALQLDVFVLSATAAIGLIILLNTISAFGALTSALLMTIRQFVGILVNAGVFRHVTAVGLQGWCGVFWVGSGVWIKTNGTCDAPDEAAAQFEDDETLLIDKDDEGYGPSPSSDGSPLPTYSSLFRRQRSSVTTLDRVRLHLTQYAVPIFLPLLLVAVIGLIFPEMNAEILRPEDSESLAVEASLTGAIIEGGTWEKELHEALWPQCNNTMTERWEGSRRTALASNPRSGNTFMRELVERATGFQTSSAGYCDHSLARTLRGECDQTANLLVKTHYPDQLGGIDANYPEAQRFDQVIHLVRNPIDAIYSGWQLGHVPKTESGELDHSARLNVDNLGETVAQRADVMERVKIYLQHDGYWRSNSLPSYTVRYEDLLTSRLPSLLSLLSFLLPPASLPPLTQIACALEKDESREAYKSRKAPPFASWGLWDRDVRVDVVRALKEPWCFYGYDRMLREAVGSDTGVDDICVQS